MKTDTQINFKIYINKAETDILHTIIIKLLINNYTYILAQGYSGGQTYAEFYGKFLTDSNTNHILNGFYSDAIGSGEWEHKLLSLEFDNNQKQFKVESEGIFDFMSSEDEKIQMQLCEELNKYINQSDDFYEETIKLKPIDSRDFKSFNDNPNAFYNNHWDDTILEITLTQIWPLSLRFPQTKKRHR
jgi:hypothetical protein